MSNPWNLTPREAAAMDAYIEAGTEERAAAKLGKSFKTISHQLILARAKIGAATRVQACIAWDRWKRSGSPMPADATAWRAS